MLKRLNAYELIIVTGADHCSCLTSESVAVCGTEVGKGPEGISECRSYCCRSGMFDNIDFTFSVSLRPSRFEDFLGKGDKSGITFGVTRTGKPMISRFSVNGIGGSC